MPWPFDLEFMQRALLAGLAVGIAAPMIGVFLVQRRMSLFGDGIGHLAFAGVAGGLLAGIWPIWAALGVAVAGAVGIEQLRLRSRVGGDLALALFFYSGIAAGVVLAGLAGSLNAGLLSYLFGSILLVTTSEALTVAVLGLVIALSILLTGRAMFAVVVDEEWARVAGLPVDALSTFLAVLTAVAIVAAMPVVGILLVAALMVLPVASGQILGRSFRGTLAWSMGVGVFSVVAGLTASRTWGLAPSGSIVLASALVFCVVFILFGGRRGQRSVLGHV